MSGAGTSTPGPVTNDTHVILVELSPFELELAYEILLGQLDGESTCDSFQLANGVCARIDPETGFRTAEWHIDNRTLVGHESGECFHLVLVHIEAVSYAWKEDELSMNNDTAVLQKWQRKITAMPIMEKEE